jgi:4-azaleucine resistance transporter AzlC
MSMPQQPDLWKRRDEFWAGSRATLPLMIGSIPFAIIFGALAVANGLTSAMAAAMSAIVFAGSAQFLAVGMIGNTSAALIILTTFLVNLRHALYGATLAPHMKHLSQRWLLPLGFTLTDETFLIVVERYNRPDSSPYKHWYHFGSAASLYINWQLWTYVGIWAGSSIANPEQWGLDYALPLTFLGIVVAGTAAVLLNPLPHKAGLMVAALLGVATGLIASRLRARYSPPHVIATSEGTE